MTITQYKGPYSSIYNLLYYTYMAPDLYYLASNYTDYNENNTFCAS